MIVLTQVIHDIPTNSLEATWVERTIEPDTVVPESTSEIEDDGGTVGLVVTPAQTIPGAVTDVQIKCHSYADVQMDMFRADAAEMGTSIDEYEGLIKQIEAAIVPYVAPLPTPVPQVLTMRQARLVLLASDLLDDVEAAVEAADRATQIEFEYATEMRRDWPALLAMAGALGLTAEQLDGLFIQGASL